MGPECHRKEGCRHLKCPPQLPCATVYILTTHCDKYTHYTALAVCATIAYRKTVCAVSSLSKAIIDLCRFCQYIVGTRGLETILSSLSILRSAIPGLRAVWRTSLTCTSCGPCLQARPMSRHPKLLQSPQSPRMGLTTTLLQPGRS